MLVSVIIPTYNRAEIIKDAINSVLNQTYQEFEILVVDDKSEDQTEDVIRAFQDPRVKFLTNKRTKGAQGARNTGLYGAKGDWVAMLDSDDVWLPSKLEKQVKYVSNCNPDVVGLSAGNAKYDFDTNKVINYNIPAKRRYGVHDLLYKNYLSGFSTFFFRRESALMINGFDERFPAMQDIDFYISMAGIGEVHSIPEVLVYVRTSNNDRITTNYSKKLIASKIFNQKYNSLITKSFQLKNKAISRLLVYGWRRNKLSSLRYFHWFIAGMFIDPSNLRWVISNIKNNR